MRRLVGRSLSSRPRLSVISGSEESTEADVCQRYKVTFPIFQRVSVGGSSQDPLFGYLTQALGVEVRLQLNAGAQAFCSEDVFTSTRSQGKVSWNFTKWIVGADGVPIKRFSPAESPEAVRLVTACFVLAPLSLTPHSLFLRYRQMEADIVAALKAARTSAA